MHIPSKDEQRKYKIIRRLRSIIIIIHNNNSEHLLTFKNMC